MLLNASEHPACTLDTEWYRRVRAPRPIYDELVDHRGWLHRVGIDAKAQNSPCTSVPAALACRALNVALAWHRRPSRCSPTARCRPAAKPA